jgi:hypothetical protein
VVCAVSPNKSKNETEAIKDYDGKIRRMGKKFKGRKSKPPISGCHIGMVSESLCVSQPTFF